METLHKTFNGNELIEFFIHKGEKFKVVISKNSGKLYNQGSLKVFIFKDGWKEFLTESDFDVLTREKIFEAQPHFESIESEKQWCESFLPKVKEIIEKLYKYN